MNRVETTDALFNLLRNNVKGVVTISQDLKHWDDVPVRDMPALFLAKGSDSPAERRLGIPVVWTMNSSLYLYVGRKNSQEVPAHQLNLMLDRIEKALDPTGGVVPQTLGLNTVSHCWISGTIETDEGNLGNKAVAVIPIEILVKY